MDNPKTVILKIGYSRLREVVVYEGRILVFRIGGRL